MKTFWIIVFTILGILNCIKLLKDLYTIYRDEKYKYSNQETCHERCYFIDDDNRCDFFIAKLFWRINKTDTHCKGASKCGFYLNKDKTTGEIKYSNSFHFITNIACSSIGTITILVLSAFEIFNKLK